MLVTGGWGATEPVSAAYVFADVEEKDLLSETEGEVFTSAAHTTIRFTSEGAGRTWMAAGDDLNGDGATTLSSMGSPRGSRAHTQPGL
jgi:hypothetical protein